MVRHSAHPFRRLSHVCTVQGEDKYAASCELKRWTYMLYAVIGAAVTLARYSTTKLTIVLIHLGTMILWILLLFLLLGFLIFHGFEEPRPADQWIPHPTISHGRGGLRGLLHLTRLHLWPKTSQNQPLDISSRSQWRYLTVDFVWIHGGWMRHTCKSVLWGDSHRAPHPIRWLLWNDMQIWMPSSSHDYLWGDVRSLTSRRIEDTDIEEM